MKWLLLFFILLNCVARAQVNDDVAFRLGSYDKSFIKAHKISTVKVEISFAGASYSRQYSFDNDGYLTYTATFTKNGQKANESFFRFNLHGDKVYEKYVDCKTNTADSSIYERVYQGNKQVKESSTQAGYSTEYFYNAKGQIEKTLTSNSFGVSTATSYWYDAKGNPTEVLWVQNNTRKLTSNQYNKEGRLIEFKEVLYEPMDTVGNLFLHKRLSYAPNGKVAKEEYVEGYAGLDKDNIEYSYDRKGNLVVCKKGEEKRLFTYDGKGYLVSKETHLAESLENSTETYHYFFGD